MILLCLALPLTVGTGYASDSKWLTGSASVIDAPNSTVAPVSDRQAADRTINNEIFHMVLADTNTEYNLSSSVKDGVVTMGLPFSNPLALQRMVNDMWQLRGVTQVKNEHGADLASTLVGAVTMAR